MATAKNSKAKDRSAKRPVLAPVVISINPGTPDTGPTVNHSVAVVHNNQPIQWAPTGPLEWWVVKIEPNDSVDDGKGGYVFYPGHQTTAPLEFGGADIIKYTVATPTGVLDPHIIPMP